MNWKQSQQTNNIIPLSLTSNNLTPKEQEKKTELNCNMIPNSKVVSNGIQTVGNPGDWTEHFDIYLPRKPTNASKWPLYCDV
jgi:hypothetical protein